MARASTASLCCFLEQYTLILASIQEDLSDITEKLLTGTRIKSNKPIDRIGNSIWLKWVSIVELFFKSNKPIDWWGKFHSA